jgi:Short C-terminal domain
MKKLTLIIACLAPLFCLAQETNDYRAINGVTYHRTDTVRLGKGSDAGGDFLYIEERGIPSPSHKNHYLPKQFANGGVIIKNIKIVKLNGIKKYEFIVDAGGLFNFAMFIDDAILACEVLPCGQQTSKPVPSVADEIKKLKELLDSGAITKAEYDAQKKKLLNQ